MRDMVLPAFAMDCRDWLVITPSEAGLPDELAGSPLLAVLSTAVVGEDSFRAASGVLTLALLDTELATRPVSGAPVAVELLDRPGAGEWVDEGRDGTRRYVLPAPEGQLALLAEFDTPDGDDDEVVARIEALMASFRWAA